MTGHSPYIACALAALTACGGASADELAPAPARAPVHANPLTLHAELRLVRELGNEPLRSGATVISGDRLRIEVKTSVLAHIYLVYCDSMRAPTVFPTVGSVVTRARETTVLPSTSGSIVIDGEPGTELLYVIASRRELARADPVLARALNTSGRDENASVCREALRSPAKRRRVPRRDRRETTLRGLPPDGVVTDKAPPDGAAGAEDDREEALPPVTIERGMHLEEGGAEITARNDVVGVVILRYELKHVSPPAPAPSDRRRGRALSRP